MLESGSHQGGCGRLKHLEVKSLWVQEKVSEKALRLRKHPTETNIVDLATKYLSKHRMEMLLTERNLVLIKEGEGMVSASCRIFGSEHRDGFWVQNIVMDSEVKMFFLIRRVVFCNGYVLTQLFCVTELNNLLHCAIDDWFVNDRLDMGVEIGGTGWDDGFP